jgi:hypothetical protein
MFLRQIRSTDGTGTLSYLLPIDETKGTIINDPDVEDTRHIPSTS